MSGKFEILVSLWVISLLSTLIAVFALTSQSPSIHAQLEPRDDSALDNSSRGQGNWTTYTNDVIGISFDYPSGWEIKEKQNRFDSVADVTISDGTNNSQFRISKSEGPFTLDVGELTRHTAHELAKELEIIELTDVKKYEIGGDKTATFLAKSDEGDSQYGIQFIYVIHKEVLYLLAFRDLTSTFDTPESQNILNKFIQSFRFLS